MIRSFKDPRVAQLFEERKHRDFATFTAAALRKLDLLASVDELALLREPPGNRLEALKGDRDGQYSIRINSQFRLCFRWHGMYAYDVEIVDYHD